MRSLVLAICLLLFSVDAFASEDVLQNEPAPRSVRGLDAAIERIFAERIRRKTFFPRLKDWLEGAPPFLRDTHIELKIRTFYLNRRDEGGERAEAWAGGGSLAYESGWLADSFQIGAELYTSQRLRGKPTEDGTLLLRPRQRSYTALGQAFARLRHSDQELTIGRQALNLPYVNRRDNRMTPITFEGSMFKGRWRRFAYTAGYLTQIKLRNDDDFVSFSDSAGVPGTSNHGLALAGLRIGPWRGFSVGAISQWVKDTLNTTYVETDYLKEFGQDWALRFQSQFTHQQSHGQDELTGSSFDTWVAGGRVAVSYEGLILSLAFSSVDDGAAIRSPFGSYPGYLSLIQKDFNRAREDAWLVGVSYDFTPLGIPGLSFFANFAEGVGAHNVVANTSLPDRREFDLTFDYRPPEGFFKGFWLRFRLSTVDFEDRGSNSNSLRVILRYDLPVL